MSHAIDSIPPVTLPSNAPGNSTTIAVRVTGVVQPPSEIAGTVTVAFNGESVSTPLTVQFADQVAPTATVDLPGLTVAVGEPVQDSAEVWRFPVTITAV